MKIYQLLRIFLFCLSILTLTVPAFPTNRHTYHTSLTRIDYNAEQKLYEISIQIFTHDLVPLLERKQGKNIDLEKTAGIDKAIFDYLNNSFVISDKSGAKKDIKWVGKEIDTDAVWIYLETSANESIEGYTLQNTVFFESFPEQTNIVVCRFEGKKAELLFKVGDKLKEITVDSRKEEN